MAFNIFSPKSKGDDSAAVIFQATGADKDAIARSMDVDPDAEPDLYAFLCKALDAPLPHPWTEHADKKGRVFYWNPASRHSSWQHPLTPSHKSLVAAYRRIMQEEDRQSAIQAELEAFQQQVEEEVGKWRQSHAPDGTPYFYKIGTQNTRWDNPRDELMAHTELRVKMLDELARMPLPEPVQQDDEELVRTQNLGTLADASAIMDATQSPAAIADLSGTAAIADGTGTVIQSPASLRPPALTLPSSDAEGGSPNAQGQTSTLRSFLDRVGRGRRKKGGTASSSASEASDGESGIDTPKSTASSAARSIMNFFSSGFRRHRSPGPKKTDTSREPRMSPQRRQLEELAAGKVGRAAKRWIVWTRVKKWEAATAIQKAWRGLQGRKAARAWAEALEAARLAAEALPPELQSLERSLKEAMNSPLGRHRNRITFERSQLLGLQGDLDLSDYLIPDEIALHHHMNFDLPIDKAVFNIIRPLLLRPLPVPWQLLHRDHGRMDFWHAGVKEERRLHPLHAFFGEVITFLKAHVHTDVPMMEPMTAQVFREASPQFLRQRLGVWVGPHEDASQVGGLRFKRLWPGEDPDCAEGEERYDDPRLEAAASVTARLEAWLHLWLGFAPEEPFPFLEGRLRALATQVSEVVVVAPGAAAEALLAQLKAEKPLAMLALEAHPVLDPKEPEVLPLTEAEEALQPIVTGTLGKAYGSALEYMAKLEAGKLEAERPPKPEVVEEEESEGEYTEIGEEEDYEDSFADEEDDESEKSDDELSEDISAATTAAQTPKSSRRPMQDIDGMNNDLAQKDKGEKLPKEVQSFLPGYGDYAASDWASRQLRPLTPTEDRTPEPDRYCMPGTPGRRPWHRQKPRTGQVHLWGENTLLADSELRLEYQEPPLEDWGKGPESAAQAAKFSPGSPVSFRVPLSPKDRLRATDALPHLAEPMKKGELLKIRQEQQVKVDDFTKSLMHATSNFDDCLQEARTPPGSPSGRWRCAGRNSAEIDGFRSGRPDLPRPNLPQNLAGEFGSTEDDVCPIKGCVAQPNTPTKGSMPIPPHLEGATKASKKLGLKAWPVERSSSAGAAVNRSRPETRYRVPRPRSSNARARKRFKGLLPEKPSEAAIMAAHSCRRYLSRTCGTMQLALNTFDSTGDGKFNRFEWENGLKKIGYEAHYDVQELFSILDKRKHHVLTLSDLLDHYNGLPITEGLPEPGLNGIASEIIYEAMIESLGPVITRALAQLLQKELLAPRGLPFTLPSIKWMKKKGDLSSSKKIASRNPHQPLALSGDEFRTTPSASDRRKNRRTQYNMEQQSNLMALQSPQAKSPPGRRARKNLTKFQVVGQMMRRKVRKGAELGSSTPLERTTSSKTVTGTFNSTLSGPFGGSEKSLSGSPFYATTHRKKGMLGSTGMSSTHQSASSSLGMSANKQKGQGTSGQRGNRRNSASRSPKPSRSPQPDRRHSSPKDPSRRKTSTVSGTSGLGHAKDGASRRPASQPQRRGVRPENKYVGYNFIKDEAPPADSELGSWQREKLLPWMPRPTEDVCRTYGHVFRLLNDPKTKKMSQMSQKPQKKTVHVSVPRMPTVPPGRGSGGLGGSPGVDGSSDEDGPDGVAPLPSKLGSGKKMWGAKSSPDLLTSHLSTTAGTARPGSAGSMGSEDDPDRMRVSLPKLMRGASPIDTGMAR